MGRSHVSRIGAHRPHLRLTRTLLVAAVFVVAAVAGRQAGGRDPGVRFEIAFAGAVHPEPITGRVYVAISRDDNGSPIQHVGPTGVPLFASNIEGLRAGEPAVIDGRAFGHPVASLNDLPEGDYFVQAFVNIYTRFARADGHTVWLHMDQWEGQDWRRSPGNLFSSVTTVHVDPKAGTVVRLVCDQVIPQVPVPPDTEYVKHLKFESRILSKWWGQPIYLGATVLLPKGYDEHPEAKYPVNYAQNHFSLRAPGGFGSGGEFDRLWLADDTPRFIYVTFQQPTPYYDDSYAVNSENNGPYGDAIMQELIREVDERFRVIQGALGAEALRRVDRRMGGARAADLPSRVLRRRLGELPRFDRLPLSPGRQRLR